MQEEVSTMKRLVWTLVLLPVSLFGQAATLGQTLDANAAADSLSKRLDSLRLFDGQPDGSKVQTSPHVFRSPRILQAGKTPQQAQQPCAIPLLDATPRSNDESMHVVKPTSPPDSAHSEVITPRVCGEALSANAGRARTVIRPFINPR
jgi:hypothetical protein